MDWLGALSHVLAAGLPTALLILSERGRRKARRELARPIERSPTGQHTPLRDKILVVDDEPTVRGLIARICVSERLNVDVHAAGGADEAIVYARHFRYRAALLDVRLPDGDVAEVVRALNDPPALLFFSGDHASAEQAAHEHHGIAVDKFDLDAITEAIRAALAAR